MRLAPLLPHAPEGHGANAVGMAHARVTCPFVAPLVAPTALAPCPFGARGKAHARM